MWRITGSVILVLGGLFLMYFFSRLTAEKPFATNALILRAAAPGFIAIVVGFGQWAWRNSMWLILGSVVLILGGGLWMFFCASMGVMVFDNPSTTVATYLSEVIPIATPGLITIVVGVGQLIEKLIIWRRFRRLATSR